MEWVAKMFQLEQEQSELYWQSIDWKKVDKNSKATYRTTTDTRETSVRLIQVMFGRGNPTDE